MHSEGRRTPPSSLTLFKISVTIPVPVARATRAIAEVERLRQAHTVARKMHARTLAQLTEATKRQKDIGVELSSVERPEGSSRAERLKRLVAGEPEKPQPDELAQRASRASQLRILLGDAERDVQLLTEGERSLGGRATDLANQIAAQELACLLALEEDLVEAYEGEMSRLLVNIVNPLRAVARMADDRATQNQAQVASARDARVILGRLNVAGPAPARATEGRYTASIAAWMYGGRVFWENVRPVAATKLADDATIVARLLVGMKR